MSNEWGFGRGSINHKTGEYEGVDKQKPFDHFFLGARKVPLFWGEHPNSTSDNKIYAVVHGDDPTSFHGHRRHTKIVLQTSNRFKSSELSGDDIRAGGLGQVYIDDVPVGEFGFRDIDDGLVTAQVKLRELFGGGVKGGLWDEEEVRALYGQKIYYDGRPAVITDVFLDQGSIWVEPACEGGFNPAPYVIEQAYENNRNTQEEWEMEGYHTGGKVELDGPSIWRWRDVPAPRDEELIAKGKANACGVRGAVMQHAETLLRELITVLDRNGMTASLGDHILGDESTLRFAE